MSMYKITVRQVNELTDYVEADSKEMAEYIAKQRVGKGIYNLDSVDSTGEVVITAEESDDVPRSEESELSDLIRNTLFNDKESDWDQNNISGSLSDLR